MLLSCLKRNIDQNYNTTLLYCSLIATKLAVFYFCTNYFNVYQKRLNEKFGGELVRASEE